MIVGTCSNCGGAVETPDHWAGTQPAASVRCRDCKAVAIWRGLTISMGPPRRRVFGPDGRETDPRLARAALEHGVVYYDGEHWRNGTPYVVGNTGESA